MDILTLQQISESVVAKSEQMAESDPHGLIITVVSVSVVFAALIILYFAYALTGKLVNWRKDNSAQADSVQEKADDSVHDNESYIITIKNEYTPVAHSYKLPTVQSADSSETAASSGETITAPLPGIILNIKVKQGEVVKEGQTVAILEAMKMENEIQAEHGGVVHSINVSKGDSVLEGTTIVTLR